MNMAMMSVMWMWLFGMGGWFGAAPGTAVSDAARQALVQRFATEAAFLETGGDLYVIRDLDGHLEATLNGVAGMATVMGPGASADAQAFAGKIAPFCERNGLFAVRSVGVSTVPRPDGLRSLRAFVMRDAAAAELPFWRGTLGGAPGPGSLLAYLPADTVLASQAAGEPAALWRMIRSGMLDFACGGDEAQLKVRLAEASRDLGADIDALFASFSGEWVFSLQLAESATTQIPGPAGMLSISTPSFLIAARASDDTALLALVHAMSRRGGQVTTSQVEGLAVHMLAQPLPGPLPLQPAVAFDGNTVLFAGSPAAVGAAVRARRDGGGLTASKAYAEVFGKLPRDSNARFFCDARFAKTLNQVRAQLDEAKGGLGNPMAAFTQLLGPPLPEASSGWVAVNGPDGIRLQGTGTGMVARQLAGIGGMNPALLAGIALPSFFRARQTAQRNACINNLRQIDLVKQQWAQEKNAAAGATPTAQDISPYLKGGFENLRCPQGGTYQVNPLGQRPTCSIPGHRLQ